MVVSLPFCWWDVTVGFEEASTATHHRRLLEPIGHKPAAEKEAEYHQQQARVPLVGLETLKKNTDGPPVSWSQLTWISGATVGLSWWILSYSNRGAHSQGGVALLPVVEDFQVFEGRVG